MTEPWYAWARTRFDASRQIHGHEDPRCRRRHGHSFQVEARYPQNAWVDDGLVSRLREIGELLDYQDLNERFGDAGDQAILSWIGECLGHRPGGHLALSAGLRRGMVHRVDGRWLLWFKDRFEASHFLPQVPAGHKCGRLHGHGFEVVLYHGQEQGALQVVESWRRVALQLQGRCLNDIHGLEMPTSEVLAAWIWQRMADHGAPVMYAVVFETASCGSAYDGAGYRIWKHRSFDSALWSAQARNGHTFGLSLGLSAPMDQAMGWIMDFGDIKRLFDPVYRELDHQPLHDRVEPPNSRGVLAWIIDKTRPMLPALDHVELALTPEEGAVWALSLRDGLLR